ncbi:hypothetical protein HNO88_001894 [Novosphingobium chloroacetimidivorans]|uniref:Uncharacterized protein n=1 Tax=Novosphingobium chloroacetimidivorans TaxID=1428314 RepID=A0A7W7K9S6_9SPHN|nr:hypothetical protein [Novosphingobium chloroacetimidivorans]MBB4858571.1 hypothetical protein [Novosphingobium chloroacetimidivorans]
MKPHSLRRALVLTSEQARHPYRRSLPPHVFRPFPDEPEAPRDRSLREVFDEDWRSLVSTYCATFIVVTTFLA